MIGNERHGLVGVIASDILRNGKIPLILLIAVLVSAIFVVTTAHRTRLLTAQREQLVLERDALDIEWRNLIHGRECPRRSQPGRTHRNGEIADAAR